MSQKFNIAKPRPKNEPAIDIDERHFRHAADFLPAPVVYCDRARVFRYANPAAAEWLGKPLSNIIGYPMAEVLIPGRPELSAPRHTAVLNGEKLTLEETRLCGDGKIRHVRLDYVPDYDDGGNVVGFFVLLTDLTNQRNAEAKATHTYQQLKLIVDAIPAMIAYCDRNSRYLVANQTMADWFQTDTDALIGKTPWDLYGRSVSHKIAPSVERVMSGQRVDYESTRHYPNGQTRVVNTTLIPDTDSDGNVIGYFVMVTDITERKLAEEKLATLAYQDSLTGVTNRRRFAEVCADEITRSQRYGHPLSIVVCDLDHFKYVNDTYGHDIGDIVLKEFADICVEAARHQLDRVARLGGEEFAVLLPETSVDGARILAERLRQQCAGHIFDPSNNTLGVTISVGITEWRHDEPNMEPALKRADVALYTAKDNGRNQVVAG